MTITRRKVVIVLALLTTVAAASRVDTTRLDQSGEGTIEKVLKIMKEMMEASKEDGLKDREVFAKFRCYCDTNKDEKTKNVADLTKEIALLEGELTELKGDVGKRSTENGELAPLIEENEEARETAEMVRGKEKASYEDEKADLTTASEQLAKAIETLAGVGADQTDGNSNAMHDKFMAGKGAAASAALVKLKANVDKALADASIFATAKQQKKITAFLQAPFTGTYTSQSVEIMGILKNMGDTFKSNLATAAATEKAAKESHEAFMKVKTDNYEEMKATFEENEKILARNDDDISSKTTAKEEAEKSKASDEEFLTKLAPLCEAKTKEYEDRKMIRASEEAAIIQAIGILNTEGAQETFGKTKATSEGGTGASFLQVASVSEHAARIAEALQDKAAKLRSFKLAKIAAMLQEGNPFTSVITSVGEMEAVINKEEQADVDQKAFCDSERETSTEQKEAKADAITNLIGDIETLDDTVNNEGSGLKQQMAEKHDELKQNREDQREEIAQRKAENKVYQAEITTLHDAEKTLKKATKVLKKFYDWLKKKSGPHHYEKKDRKDSGGHNIKQIKEATLEELEKACSETPECAGFNTAGYLKEEIQPEDKWYDTDETLYVKVFDEGFVQTGKKSTGKTSAGKKEDPEAPETWDSSEGAGMAGKGGDVVGMLEYIYDETVKEEEATHMGEEANQHEFEADMDELKKQEKEMLDTITDLEEEIANKEDLIEKKYVDKFDTEKEEKALERYLEKIKPGCDFIDENLETRQENRKGEISALEEAIAQLKSTPAYKDAVAEEEARALGDCKELCEDKEAAQCQACLGGVTVSAFCAGHPETSGC